MKDELLPFLSLSLANQLIVVREREMNRAGAVSFSVQIQDLQGQ